MTIKKALNPLRSPIIAVVVLALLVLVAIGVKARVWRNPGAVASNPQQLIPTHGPVQVVRFTLYDAGIYPREVRARAGLIAVAIEDLSGGTQGLALTRVVNGQPLPVGLVERFANHWRGRSEIRLNAGRYEVFDSSRPSNRATLVVEP
jgi:hypothetical protein